MRDVIELAAVLDPASKELVLLGSGQTYQPRCDIGRVAKGQLVELLIGEDGEDLVAPMGASLTPSISIQIDGDGTARVAFNDGQSLVVEFDGQEGDDAEALMAPLRQMLADEPTGELDSGTAGEIVEVLRTVNEAQGLTIVVVTHDPLIADHVSRTVAIRDGRTSSEVLRRTETDGDGTDQVVAEEFAVLDRVGRLQLPHDYLEALELSQRVRLTLDPDHINVWPDESNGGRSVGESGGDSND